MEDQLSFSDRETILLSLSPHRQYISTTASKKRRCVMNLDEGLLGGQEKGVVKDTEQTARSFEKIHQK